MANNSQPSGWVGWIYFAGILLLVRGFFQLLFGIEALVNDKVYVVAPNHLAAFDFTTWGWIHVVLAVVLLSAAGSLMAGRLWGRVVASLAVGASLVANLAFLPAYPLWSIIAIVVDVLILYAVLVKAGEVQV
jgi:hypothetical protein